MLRPVKINRCLLASLFPLASLLLTVLPSPGQDKKKPPEKPPVAEPVIRAVDMRGVQIGANTTLTLDGDDLSAVRLLLPFPAKQELKPTSTDKKAIIDITPDAAVVPGYYQFWAVTEGGISAPVLIGVDRLPQKLLAPLDAAKPQAAEQVPVALHGSVAGGATIETRFQGKAKQRLFVEVEAQRFGSKLRPIIHLLSPKKLQVAWSWGSPTLFGDCRLEATLPEDGDYTVTLHDAEYAAPAPGYFRLKIGEWSAVDQVFPPVLSRGKPQVVELLGPSGTERLDVPAPKSLGVLPLPWPKNGLWSGPRPFVTVGSHAEFVKETLAGKLQELPIGPVAVSGRLLMPFDEDRYRLAVTPGKKIKLEVFAERIGSPLDTAVVVRNEKGDLLARADDSPGSLDPVLEYAVPDKVTAIIVGVVDAQGRAGPRGIYRLVIDPQPPAIVGEDWRLSTTTSRLTVPLAGRAVMPVFLERRGYLGKVDLAATLPGGLRADGTLIPEGADGTLLSLERSDAPLGPGILHWNGRGLDGSDHPVVIKQHPLEKLQPWLASEIALTGTNIKASDFVVDWRELPKDAGIVLGGKLLLPVKLARTRDKTTVKLTLLTSQFTPLLNNQPDPAKALRQEKLVEVPANQPNGELTLLVPPELSSPVYDVTVQAELLDAGKKILATTFTPVRRLPVRVPLIVELAGPNRVEALLDRKKGTTVAVKGKIIRKEGAAGEVAVTLTGLPAGVSAAPVTVKADAADFVVNVVLPATLAAGEIKGLKLSALIGTDPKQPNLRVRSRDVEVTLVVTAAK